MRAFHIRPATKNDLPRLTEIYNHYVINTAVTFDIEPYSVERRIPWFNQFGLSGRYRLLVAEDDSGILGYAGSTKFRPKPWKRQSIAHRTLFTRAAAALSTVLFSKR
jgi:phosphinothricin acetyltransferase